MGPRTCTACGLELRDSARFCDGCGSRVSAADNSEYKQVTVMFADVVRSMDIAAAVGPERLGEIMGGLLDRATDVVGRYGGVVNQFTGDGLMAVFGVPHALEDHARMACLAALGLREQVRALAADVLANDGIGLHLRIGLNSGEVIAGEIGAGAHGYTTIGEHVGLAQRMEAAAPVDGVLLSGATARLVEDTVTLGPPQSVAVKGRPDPMSAHVLLGDAVRHRRQEPALVGRARELGIAATLLERSLAGNGSIVRIVGPAGIGKTRMVDEIAGLAEARGLPTVTAYCESHTSAVPYVAVSRFLRSLLGLSDTRGETARHHIRSQVAGSGEDLTLLDELLGVSDSSSSQPEISDEARQRRLVALLQNHLLTRKTSALFVVEDVHWIDGASELMLTELAATLRQTTSLTLLAHRPDYRGALSRIHGSECIVVAPLPASSAAALITELLGADPSVRAIADRIVERASGNPFFITEIVRDLVERGVLAGERGDRRCADVPAEIAVPPTLRATIAARIDRLAPSAKSVLFAGAVIGMRFNPILVDTVVDDGGPTAVAVDELLDAELVECVSPSEYAFRHPLVRAVAYESQLRAARARMHLRVAQAIEHAEPASVDQNAALIAGHHEAAGDLRTAYDWHMRAGSWLSQRDRNEAWTSWQRARKVADRISPEDSDRARLRTIVLSRLCGEVWKTGGKLEDAGFEDLRQLCGDSGDHRSLAIGTAGIVLALTGQHRHREAIELIPELLRLTEIVREPPVICGMLLAVAYAKSEVGALRDALSLVDQVIDIAGRDKDTKGLLFASPLASALRMRGLYGMCLGERRWRADADAAEDCARGLDHTSRVSSILYKYILSVPSGARRVDDVVLRETTEALEIAGDAGDEHTLTLARLARGLALVYGDHPGPEGADLLRQARETTIRRQFTMNAAGLIEPALARHSGLHGDLDSAITLAHEAISKMSERGEVLSIGVATTVLVESLLKRGEDGDAAHAAAAVQHLEAVSAEEGLVLLELPALRLSALLAERNGRRAECTAMLEQYESRALAAGFDL